MRSGIDKFRVKSFVKNLGDVYFWPASQNELRKLLRRYPGPTATDILSVISSYKGRGWYKRLSAYQIADEFKRLIEWALTIKPKIVLEIGTAQGATLFAWCRIAGELVVSIDLEGGIHGGGYAPQKQRLYREFVTGRGNVDVALLQADSHKEETRLEIEKILDGRLLDILFIDGDHRYLGVKRDFELWSPLVRPGGYVVFHDIVPHTRLKGCEVDRLWQQLKATFTTQEIVAGTNEGWGGIGILQIAR